MKLSTILNELISELNINEVGEGSKEMVYKWYRIDSRSKDEEIAIYTFTTDYGLNYVVEIKKDSEGYYYLNDLNYEVLFGIAKGVKVDYETTGKEGKVYRVMATVLDIIRNEVELDKSKEYNVVNISAIPTKETETDMRRSKLYKAYAAKFIDAKKIDTDPSGNLYIQVGEPHPAPTTLKRGSK